MQNNIPQPLLELKTKLHAVTDPRTGRATRHVLLDVLLISICASLCGAQTFTDIALFGRCQQEWFKTWLALPHGIPSHDTFNRLFGLINPAHFRDVFVAWTQSLRHTVAGEVVAIDGKTLRGSATADHGPLHLVNVWASANRLILGRWKVADHSNEITALPELLRALELAGCPAPSGITVDALNCQKNVAKEISEADADYVLALKGNHGTLHDEVKTFLDDAIARCWRDLSHSFHETLEKAHGRIETRRYWITEAIDWLADKPQWEKLRSVAVVEATRDVRGQVSTERRYYLTSLSADAVRLAGAVRGHWEVENCVHWVLDVQLGEDGYVLRQTNAVQNLATLRVLTLNLLRRDQTHKVGVRAKQKAAGWSSCYLLHLLNF